MTFRALKPITVRWRPLSGAGLQQVTVAPVADGVVARGVIVGGEPGGPYGVSYTIACDQRWVARSLDLETTDGRAVHLRSDGNGGWREASGVRVPRFDGCIDPDLQGSPFTNTLPIRRTGLTPARGALALSVLYVPFDTFEPMVDGQIYRCLTADRRYRYESADGTFAAEIAVDEDGLVVDYPPLFQRVSLG
jgi:uncharacterized protein